MAKIRDFAVTIYSAVTASMVCEMPEHASGDLLVAFVNKDTASNFTTPAGWTAGQTQTSAGAAGGVYYKRAASAAETVTFTLTSETCCAVVIAVQNVNGTTEGDAVSGSAKSGADDSSLPLSGVGITPSHNNCLILHGLSTDSGIGANALPPWINLFAGDTGANSLCVSYTQQKTAAAIAAPDHWAGAADDSRGFIIAIRDDGNGEVFDAYLPVTTTPATQITPLNGTSGTVDKGTWAAVSTPVVSPLAGKTVSGLAIANTADSGINPFRGSARDAGVSSTTQLSGISLDLTSTFDVTALQGLVFGTFFNLAPRDYVDTGKVANGGKYILLGSDASNYKAWVVGGQFSKTERPDARNNFLIEVASSDTTFGSAGTANFAALDDIMLGGSGYYGAASVLWNELYSIGVFQLAGGAAAAPISFEEVIFAVNNGGGILPLLQQAGSGLTAWCPLKFGGTDPIHVACNLNTFQFPRKADAADYVDFHVSNNKVGIEFDGQDRGGGDVDTISFTNCVFTSPSSYYWRFASTHDAGAAIDFSGSSVVNAAVTLRAAVSLANMTFINCPSFTQNGATIADCVVSGTKITSDDPALISGCRFVSTGAGGGHAIEITEAGSYTFDGNIFEGFGADGSTDAAIYNSAASGSSTVLGDDTLGGSSSGGNNDRAVVSKFTSSVSGDLTGGGIQFAASSTAGCNAKLVIYSDTAGEPGNLIAASTGQAVPSGGGLVTFTLSGASVGSGNDYWIGVAYDNFQAAVGTDSVTSEARLANGTFSYSSPPSTFPTTSIISYSSTRVNAYVDVLSGGTPVTLTIVGGGTATPTVRNASGATTTLVGTPVTTSITVKDINTQAALQNARVLLYASSGAGPIPFEESVSITRSGTTATVTHAAHGFSTNQKVLIRGADQSEYNGVKQITVSGADTYTFTVSGSPATPATGTPECTGVIIDGLTNVSGVITDSRPYSSNQPVTGFARRASAGYGTLYKSSPISGTINAASGLDLTVLMIPDE